MCKKITVTTTYVTDATLIDTRSIPINKQAGENSELGISESNITNFPKLTYNYKQKYTDYNPYYDLVCSYCAYLCVTVNVPYFRTL
jgi:hypothetical protein